MKLKNKMPDTEIKVIQFPPGEFKPLFVSAKDINRVVLGISNKTLANWRSEKKGPKYFLDGQTVYYRVNDLENYFSRCPVQTNGSEDN